MTFGVAAASVASSESESILSARAHDAELSWRVIAEASNPRGAEASTIGEARTSFGASFSRYPPLGVRVITCIRTVRGHTRAIGRRRGGVRDQQNHVAPEGVILPCRLEDGRRFLFLFYSILLPGLALLQHLPNLKSWHYIAAGPGLYFKPCAPVGAPASAYLRNAKSHAATGPSRLHGTHYSNASA